MAARVERETGAELGRVERAEGVDGHDASGRSTRAPSSAWYPPEHRPTRTTLDGSSGDSHRAASTTSSKASGLKHSQRAGLPWRCGLSPRPLRSNLSERIPAPAHCRGQLDPQAVRTDMVLIGHVEEQGGRCARDRDVVAMGRIPNKPTGGTLTGCSTVRRGPARPGVARPPRGPERRPRRPRPRPRASPRSR